MSAEAKALVSDAGTVVGVKVAMGDDEVFLGAKKGVVLTAGGFEMNRPMLEKYLPSLFDGLANVPCPPYNTGECIRMGLGMGADMAGYDSTGSYDGGVWWKDYEPYETRMTAHVNKDGNQALRQPWLLINNRGERVPYLGTTYQPYPYKPSGCPYVFGLTDQATVEIMQPSGRTYVCFDSKYDELVSTNYFKQGVCRVGKTIPDDDPLIDRVPEWQRDWRTGFQQMIDAGAVQKCDTIEELEAALGLSEGLLVSAVEQWNAACEAGEDYLDAFKYDPSWLIPIDEPPYYGAKIGGNIFTTKCGLRINPKMQVLKPEGDVHCRLVRWMAYGWRRERRGQHRGQAVRRHVRRRVPIVRRRLYGGGRHHGSRRQDGFDAGDALARRVDVGGCPGRLVGAQTGWSLKSLPPTMPDARPSFLNAPPR